MKIGIPKEIKNNENRISATPSVVFELTSKGHTVYIEQGAGLNSSIEDQEYIDAGATILAGAKSVWEESDLIYKVKEPIPSEYKYFRPGLIIYTYLHLAANPQLTQAMLDAQVIGIAFETVRIGRSLPLLAPMSEVAGKMAIQAGMQFLTKPFGGKGKLLSGVTGVSKGQVVIVGAGIAGTAAAHLADGIGAKVTMLDVNIERLREITEIFSQRVETLYSSQTNIARSLKEADLVISTVLIPGAKAPKLITKEMVAAMEPGSVIVDVAIDQGGSTEYTENRPTSHDKPVFIESGVVHYAVANIPGAVAQTSSHALCNATAKYITAIANLGLIKALEKYPELGGGFNVVKGHVTNQAVASSLNYEYQEVLPLL